MSDLSYAPKSAWEIYHSVQDRAAVRALADSLLAFLTLCKTERETVDWVEARLRQAGFASVFQPAQGRGSKSKGVYLTLHGKALFAVRRGKKPLAGGLRLICAHADTPRLDLKQRPLLEQVGLVQAKTHYYGGIRKHQWLGRPLALHGVILRADGRRVDLRLGEDADDPVFTIADLLPHLASAQQEKTLAKAFEGEKLNLLLGHEPLGPSGSSEKTGGRRRIAQREEARADGEGGVKRRLLRLLHEAYGVSEEDLVSAELQAVPAGPARYVGLDKALVGAYGLDDRVCVFTALEAFLAARDPDRSVALMLWDKEEIGSEGAGSAHSRFFAYCVEDMLAAWEPATPLRRVMTSSCALSGDVSAGVDPDWQDLHEKQNSAYLGYGPAFNKFTGSRGKYGANDANAEYVARMRHILAARGIPWQMAELGKVDGGGGGTVALFLAAYGMNVIDCGPALLGMHSPFELASTPDLYATRLAYQAFYETA